MTKSYWHWWSFPFVYLWGWLTYPINYWDNDEDWDE